MNMIEFLRAVPGHVVNAKDVYENRYYALSFDERVTVNFLTMSEEQFRDLFRYARWCVNKIQGELDALALSRVMLALTGRRIYCTKNENPTLLELSYHDDAVFHDGTPVDPDDWVEMHSQDKFKGVWIP